jgi:hypothetical protein
LCSRGTIAEADSTELQAARIARALSVSAAETEQLQFEAAAAEAQKTAKSIEMDEQVFQFMSHASLITPPGSTAK